MKDSQRKDVEGGFILRDKLNILEERVKPKWINKWTDSSVLCDELGGNWTPCSNGVELRIKSNSVTATATISKNRASHLYTYGLRLDASRCGKGETTEELAESTTALAKEIQSVVDVCAKLNAEISISDIQETEE
jgi:hypothetical protein